MPYPDDYTTRDAPDADPEQRTRWSDETADDEGDDE